MSVDIPQGRDLNITHVHRRWGMANIPKWWQMMPKDTRTLANADAAIRQARKDIDFLVACALMADAQAHAARTMWNLLHA